MEAGRLLERGVLADMKGENSYPILEQALQKIRESRGYMDALHEQIGKLIRIEETNTPLPEHNMALNRILKNQSPVERVSLIQSGYGNVSAAAGVAINYGPIGANFGELLANLQTDLTILQVVTDQAIEAFTAMLPTARVGGVAAIVLSGRAPLPEKIMHSADELMVYVQFHNRACMTAIAADMQVYPRGLEWLPKPGAQAATAQSVAVPAGVYQMDPTHASLRWRVNQLGFSNYTARFTRFEATLDIDPAKPENAKLSVTVDPTSIRTDFPFADRFDKELIEDADFFNSAKFPKITFTSTRIELIGEKTAKVTGGLTLLGITKQLTIDVTLDTAKEHPGTKKPALGFSASAKLKRSDFGITTRTFIADEVLLLIEAEFIKS